MVSPWTPSWTSRNSETHHARNACMLVHQLTHRCSCKSSVFLGRAFPTVQLLCGSAASAGWKPQCGYQHVWKERIGATAGHQRCFQAEQADSSDGSHRGWENNLDGRASRPQNRSLAHLLLLQSLQQFLSSNFQTFALWVCAQQFSSCRIISHSRVYVRWYCRWQNHWRMSESTVTSWPAEYGHIQFEI